MGQSLRQRAGMLSAEMEISLRKAGGLSSEEKPVSGVSLPPFAVCKNLSVLSVIGVRCSIIGVRSIDFDRCLFKTGFGVTRRICGLEVRW